MKKKKFNIEQLPSDISDQIIQHCIEKRISELSKTSIKLLINLSQTSKEFHTKIIELSNNWKRCIKNQQYLSNLHQFDWFTLTHVIMNRCFCCHKLCLSKINSSKFNLLIHQECLMNITETMWYFDYHNLRRPKNKERLGIELCAIVDFFKLTPQKIKINIPFVTCNGYNRMMGHYTYDRFFVRPNPLIPKTYSLLGFLDVSPQFIESITNRYRFRTSGVLQEIIDYQKIKLRRQIIKKRNKACNNRRFKLIQALSKRNMTIADIPSENLGDYLDNSKLNSYTKLSHIISHIKP